MFWQQNRHESCKDDDARGNTNRTAEPIVAAVLLRKKTQAQKTAAELAGRERRLAFKERLDAARQDGRRSEQQRRENEILEHLLPGEHLREVYRGSLGRWVALTDKRIITRTTSMPYESVESIGGANRPFTIGLFWSITTGSGQILDLDFVPKGDRARFTAAVLAERERS
jgi:hypothetical protein